MPPRVGVVTIGDACEKRLVTERVELATSESCVICDCTSAIRTSEIILSQSVRSTYIMGSSFIMHCLGGVGRLVTVFATCAR